MGNSPQDSGTAHQLTADDPTVELDILEQTISMEGARALRHDTHGLICVPIARTWILEGNPVARHKRLAGSSDRLASAFMWDCTAGRFNWYYREDEIAHVLEGSTLIEDAAGRRQRLQAGDTFHFSAGSRYQWIVPGYVRKIAFLHSALTLEMRIIKGMLDRVAAPFRRKPGGTGR